MVEVAVEKAAHSFASAAWSARRRPSTLAYRTLVLVVSAPSFSALFSFRS